MTKKVKVLIGICCLLGFFITMINVYATTRCPGDCKGKCYCEGADSPYGDDPCCFECYHPVVELICCEGISSHDGCLTEVY